MLGIQSAVPPVLPSRIEPYEKALRSVKSGSPVFIIGQPGSGKATFSKQVLAASKTRIFWISAVKPLKSVPFAMLTIITAQLAGPKKDTSPTAMIAALTELTAHQKITIFLAHAECVDEQSAAVLGQLFTMGNINLLMTTTAIADLPESLSHLRTTPNAQRTELLSLNREDITALLMQMLDGQVNSSTTTLLMKFSGGNALFLSELAQDALSAKALVKVNGYWTLDRHWVPQGTRIKDLISSRLAEQPQPIREAVELLAVTGPLAYPLALELLGPRLFKLIETRLVQCIMHSEDLSTGERKQEVVLSVGLSPRTVLLTMSQSQITSRVESASLLLRRDRLPLGTRVMFTLNRISLGLSVPLEQLFEDVTKSASARHFSQVVALTSSMNGDLPIADSMGRSLLVFRADALYELGQPEAGLAILKPLLECGDAPVRFVAAKIAYAGLGRLQLAEEYLASRPGDAVELDAYRLLIRSRAHQLVDVDQLLRYSVDPLLSDQDRAACFAHALIEQCYAGRPIDALHDFTSLKPTDAWITASPATRLEFLFALPVVTASLGDRGESIAPLLADIDFESLAMDHGNFLTGAGMGLLEMGMAVEALDLFEQALALVSLTDPYLLTGFIASLAVAAAIMLGDDSKARRFYDLAGSSSAFSGQIMRPIAQRYLLSAVYYFDGKDAAMEHLERCLAHADHFGRTMLRVRLLHDAWRLGLIDDLVELRDCAVVVQGPLGLALSGYALALEGPNEELVLRTVQSHLAQGRILFAAEVANRAADLARSSGQRALASRLLALSSEIALPLAHVNTPSLGRGRVRASVLTEREYDTCVLAASGASNQEIATELYLSLRTVEGHLQRAYAKLGITDRRQLLPEVAGSRAEG